MRRKRSNWVSVSHLSAYAADPSKFCQHRGQAYNSEAANAGLKAHAQAGSGNQSFTVVSDYCCSHIGCY